MGWVGLTNDRILFTHQKFAATPSGGLLGVVVAQGLQKRYESKTGAREVVNLAKIRSAQMVHRRLLGDPFEFTMADGSTCRVSKTVRDKWGPTIRRLLAERHGRTVVDEGEHGFRVD